MITRKNSKPRKADHAADKGNPQIFEQRRRGSNHNRSTAQQHLFDNFCAELAAKMTLAAEHRLSSSVFLAATKRRTS